MAALPWRSTGTFSGPRIQRLYFLGWRGSSQYSAQTPGACRGPWAATGSNFLCPRASHSYRCIISILSEATY